MAISPLWFFRSKKISFSTISWEVKEDRIPWALWVGLLYFAQEILLGWALPERSMEILREKLTWRQLSSREGRIYQEMVKAVVDVRRELLAVEGEMHSDLESLL